MLTVTVLPTMILGETIQAYIDRLTQSALAGQQTDAGGDVDGLRRRDRDVRRDFTTTSTVTLDQSMAIELLHLAGPRLVDGLHGPALAVWPEHRGFLLIAVLRFFGLNDLESQDREDEQCRLQP